MIVIFTGPPLAGKGTQAQLLSQRLDIPVFSIGKLLRDGNEKAKEAYENYAMKGFNVPIELKFDLLREKLENLNSFILENFPATQEDLDVFNQYLSKRGLQVDKVFYIQIPFTEIKSRMGSRGRVDDTEEIVGKRKEIQDKDRQPVIDYFREKGILVEIDGSDTVAEVEQKVLEGLQ